MNEFSSPPESISHKKLNSLLTTAQKELLDPTNSNISFYDKTESFKKLIMEWSELSTELLQELRKKDNYMLEGKEPDSLMALGALEAYLQMSIQAYKGTDFK